MERVNTLINKLQQQFINNESIQQMNYTAQLLVAELSQHNEVNEIGKVSVILPNNFVINTPIEPTIITQSVEKVEVSTTRIPPLPSVPNVIDKEVFNLIVEEVEHIPTLAFQEKKGFVELNDLVHNDTQSINEILKENKKEVAANLVDTPVKDLRKAIGINDKYLFINELFNGDEAMYERSVKTINNFSVFPEAEQWIKRELFTKLCWLADNETVATFDQLIRRRFA